MQNLSMNDLLIETVDCGASDLHITVGRPPVVRVDDQLVNLDYDPLDAESARMLLYSLLTDGQREAFENELELDFAADLGSYGRFRVNMYIQKGVIGGAFRVIEARIPSLEELNLPKILGDFALLPSGFVIVTGPTGCGKSTSLAAMIDIVNVRRRCHIITIEDPIEYLHHHKNSIITQREVGNDTKSFNDALRHVLRQNPDVILVGEIRDHESMAMAITAAETGHLVLSTLHTMDAAQAIERIVDLFPAAQQHQMRIQLGGALRAVVAQQLLPRADGPGLIPALEILVATPAVRNIVRKGETHQLYSVMQTSKEVGMQTMNQHLIELINAKLVTKESALAQSPNPEELRRNLSAI